MEANELHLRLLTILAMFLKAKIAKEAVAEVQEEALAKDRSEALLLKAQRLAPPVTKPIRVLPYSIKATASRIFLKHYNLQT